MSMGLSISARDSVFISRVSAPKQILKWSVKKMRPLRLINMPPVHLLWFAGKEEGRVGCDSNRQDEGIKQTALLSSLLAAAVCLASSYGATQLQLCNIRVLEMKLPSLKRKTQVQMVE